MIIASSGGSSIWFSGHELWARVQILQIFLDQVFGGIPPEQKYLLFYTYCYKMFKSIWQNWYDKIFFVHIYNFKHVFASFQILTTRVSMMQLKQTKHEKKHVYDQELSMYNISKFWKYKKTRVYSLRNILKFDAIFYFVVLKLVCFQTNPGFERCLHQKTNNH